MVGRSSFNLQVCMARVLSEKRGGATVGKRVLVELCGKTILGLYSLLLHYLSFRLCFTSLKFNATRPNEIQKFQRRTERATFRGKLCATKFLGDPIRGSKFRTAVPSSESIRPPLVSARRRSQDGVRGSWNVSN